MAVKKVTNVDILASTSANANVYVEDRGVFRRTPFSPSQASEDISKVSSGVEDLSLAANGTLLEEREITSTDYAVSMPEGALPHVHVSKVFGKTQKWNQLFAKDEDKEDTIAGVTRVVSDGKYVFNGTATETTYEAIKQSVNMVEGHKYLIVGIDAEQSTATYQFYSDDISLYFINTEIYEATATATVEFIMAIYGGATLTDVTIVPTVIDLTAMNGAGSEPTDVSELKNVAFVKTAYDEGSIITVTSSSIESASVINVSAISSKYFPDGMNSVGNTMDEIDFDSKKAHKRIGVVDLGTLEWDYDSDKMMFTADHFGMISMQSGETAELVCLAFESEPYAVLEVNHAQQLGIDNAIGYTGTGHIGIVCDAYTDIPSFSAYVNGMKLYYILSSAVTSSITESVASVVRVNSTLYFKNTEGVPLGAKSVFLERIDNSSLLAKKSDIGSGNITIKKNGVPLRTFSANTAEDVEINIEADTQQNADWDAISGPTQILNKPTGLSAFTNDADFADKTYVDDLVGEVSREKAVLGDLYGTEEEGVPAEINADTLGYRIHAEDVEGKVNYTDSLSLSQIMAADDLTHKVASADAAKTLNQHLANIGSVEFLGSNSTTSDVGVTTPNPISSYRFIELHFEKGAWFSSTLIPSALFGGHQNTISYNDGGFVVYGYATPYTDTELHMMTSVQGYTISAYGIR